MQTIMQTKIADRQAYANAPVVGLSPKVLAWSTAHPAEYQWLTDNADSFGFAASLLQSLRKWGSLTPNQHAAVQRILVKRKIQADRHASAPAVSLAPVEAAFDKAKAAGIKYPKLRLDVFTFSPAGATSKNAGAVYVKEGDTYLGKVLNGKLFAVSACTPQQEDAIVAVAADPMSAAIAYGKRFGKCSVCARTLTDAESIARGIGPVCATRFGW
jgi:hypothetical protein